MSIQPTDLSYPASSSLKRALPEAEGRPRKKRRVEVPSPAALTLSTPLFKRSITWGFLGDAESAPIRLTQHENEMLEVTKKAALDHYIDPMSLPLDPIQRTTQPLILHSTSASEKGRRPANEDYHIIFQASFGDVFAVFDGHGDLDKEKLERGEDQLGKELSKQAARFLQERLPSLVHDSSFNIQQAFKTWCQECQHYLPTVRAGTTAVFCLFEKVNHYLHTATIGDSKAFVFRKKNSVISPIPLSPIADWATLEAEKRVESILEPEEFELWKSEKRSKCRRFPPRIGINVPSSLGDKCMHIDGKTAISPEPQCSLIQIKEDDKIVIACDGVWDYVHLGDLIENVIQPYWNEPYTHLAQAVVNYALEAQRRKTKNFQASNLGDNITAIAIYTQDPNSVVDAPSTPLIGEDSLTQPIDEDLSV